MKYHFPKAKYSREGERYPLPSMKEQCPRQCHGTGSHYWPCQSSLGPPDGKRGKAVWRHHSCPPRQHLRRQGRDTVIGLLHLLPAQHQQGTTAVCVSTNSLLGKAESDECPAANDPMGRGRKATRETSSFLSALGM